MITNEARHSARAIYKVLALGLAALAIIFTSSSEAAWGPQTIKQSSSWNNSTIAFSDPFVSTAWGDVKNTCRYFFASDEISENSAYFQVDGYSQRLRVMLSTATDNSFTMKAPLYILLPGIFGGTN